MKKITIQPAATELFIGTGLLKSAQLKEYFGGTKVVVVADPAVKDLYGADLAKQLSAELFTLPNSREAKTQDVSNDLINTLFKMKAPKETTLVAIGGGATTDLVGFAASIYMRGIPTVLIPTTLLGAVDASIGGKTAIDTPFGKNLIGTLHHPKAIFTDFDTFQTLPESEWFNGWAEILKMGLIQRTSLWNLGFEKRNDPALIINAIEAKIAVVEQDPKEKGLRRILNFGHTIGHALEAISDYQIPHGQAVAIGCAAEAHLSMQLDYLSKEEFAQIETTYLSFELKLPKNYDRSKLLGAMAHDKKRAAGELRFVLIDKIGHALPFEGAYCRPVEARALEPTLDWMEKRYA